MLGSRKQSLLVKDDDSAIHLTCTNIGTNVGINVGTNISTNVGTNVGVISIAV